MEGKYLDPKADLTFKLIFEHEDLLISLLNALLPLDEGKQIEHLEYLPAELVPENPGKKDSVVDVRCRETGGRHFIVEMQMNWNNEFRQRVILNESKAVVKQLEPGEKFELVQPVYSLNLINDTGFESDPDEFYHDYAIVDVAHTDRRIEGLRFIFIELPKFKPKTIPEKGGAQDYRVSWEGDQMAVLWLRFLTEINVRTTEAPAELLENPDTAKALKILEKSAYTEAQLIAYDRFWDAVYRERVFYDDGFKNGEIKGRDEGRAESRAEGRAEGIEQGKLETARKLKAMKVMTIEQIAEATGLTAEEIQAL